jgi:phytoene desaturase
MSKRERSAIVIGAGPGGLASAILLASSGVRVKLFERLPHVGGRTSTIEADGYKFDLGPTFFLYPRVLDEIFKAAGTSLRAEVEMTRLDPQYRLIFGAGGRLDCTPDIDRMVERISALSPQDGEGFRRFIQENRTKLHLMEPCLEQPFLSWRDLMSPRW